ncbi:MAG TPA: hypothetical protein V6D10_17500 [Trichocoleus sp.]|jgi:hypothetical protein
MTFRWKRVAIAVGISATILMGFPPAIKYGIQTIHQQRVQQAGGIWCVLVGSEGSKKIMYGAKDCSTTSQNVSANKK